MDKAAFYANARDDVRGPLDGITVLEATTTWAGPMAGCLLADFGARVIKVEHPSGEICRMLPPKIPDSNLTVPHETVNRNKENISLNLKVPAGRDLFLQLCQDADIVVENFKPGTLDSWGVGYANVAAIKNDIIYVSISGYGQFGPYCERAGYDPIAQNFSGWSSLNGDPQGGPTKAPTFLGDDLAGMNGAMAALAALQHRNRTGEGQHIDVALVDGLLYGSNGNPTTAALGVPMARTGNEFSIAAPVNIYACRDGSIYGGVLLDGHWKALCKHIARDDLAQLGASERIGRRDELNQVLADYCRERTAAEVVDEFIAIGLTVTRVNTYEESGQNEHVQARDMLQATVLSDGKTVPLTGPAAKFSRTPTRVHNAAPTLGQNNESIYAGLGVDSEALAQLKRDGVI